MTNSRRFSPVPRSFPGRSRLFLVLLAALALLLAGHSANAEARIAWKRIFWSYVASKSISPAVAASSGAWHDVPASERGRVLGEMKAGATAEYGAALDRLSDLRAQELPFYPDAILYEGRIDGAPESRNRFTFVRHWQGYVVLTGESGPIYALNASASLRLDTEPRAKAYLRFFCAALESSEGDTFTIVERADELLWKAEAGAAVRQDAERKLKQLALRRGDGDLWLAEGTILYRNSLYDIRFEIAPDGQVKMLSDRQQSAELPVQSPRFAEVVRRARQSDHPQPSGSDHHERTRL